MFTGIKTIIKAFLFSCIFIPVAVVASDEPTSLTARDIMLAIVIPSSDAMWAVGMDDDTPKPDEYWVELEYHATKIITAGVALKALGHGDGIDAEKDKKWLNYNNDMIKVAQSALDAARAKNFEGVLNAGNYLLDPCSACHKDFMTVPQ